MQMTAHVCHSVYIHTKMTHSTATRVKPALRLGQQLVVDSLWGVQGYLAFAQQDESFIAGLLKGFVDHVPGGLCQLMGAPFHVDALLNLASVEDALLRISCRELQLIRSLHSICRVLICLSLACPYQSRRKRIESSCLQRPGSIFSVKRIACL